MWIQFLFTRFLGNFNLNINRFVFFFVCFFVFLWFRGRLLLEAESGEGGAARWPAAAAATLVSCSRAFASSSSEATEDIAPRRLRTGENGSCERVFFSPGAIGAAFRPRPKKCKPAYQKHYISTTHSTSTHTNKKRKKLFFWLSFFLSLFKGRPRFLKTTIQP